MPISERRQRRSSLRRLTRPARMGVATDPSYARWRVLSATPGRLRAQHPLLGASEGAARGVERRLLRCEVVTSYAVSRVTAKVLVTYDERAMDAEDVVALLTELMEAAAGDPEPEPGPPLTRRDVAGHQLVLSSAAMTLAGASLAVPGLNTVAVAATVLSSASIVARGLDALLVRRKVKVDILDSVVIVLLFAHGRYRPAAVMAWALALANSVLETAAERSRAVLSEVFGKQPRSASVLVDGTEVRRDLADVRAGDVVVVRAGEHVPVDGTVIDGEAMVDQRSLTGEFSAVEKSPPESILEMTVVLAGQVAVRVDRTGDETTAARVVGILRESSTHRGRVQTVSERFADAMVVPTLAIGAAGHVVAGPGATVAIINADYGTGIRVAAPLALVASIARAARNGVIVKHGGVLESLHKIDVMVFDKTGTLTQETPVVRTIASYDPAFPAGRVLAYAASAEQTVSHPVARAVLRRAGTENVPLPVVDKASYRVGRGVEVTTTDRESIKVGSPRYMEDVGVEIPARATADFEEYYRRGTSPICLAAGGRVVGSLELAAAERPEATSVVEWLRHRRGIKKTYLVSGDNEPATRVLAARLRIDSYRAGMLPEQKAAFISQLQASGLKVGMVGDGINDSVALSRADFSFSLRGGADVATDVADVVFMDGDLAKFDSLFDLSDALRRNVRRSFVLVLVPNTVLIAGAMAGVFGIGSSLLLNNGVNLLAVANGLLPFYRSGVTKATGVPASAPSAALPSLGATPPSPRTV